MAAGALAAEFATGKPGQRLVVLGDLAKFASSEFTAATSARPLLGRRQRRLHGYLTDVLQVAVSALVEVAVH